MHCFVLRLHKPYGPVICDSTKYAKIMILAAKSAKMDFNLK